MFSSDLIWPWPLGKLLDLTKIVYSKIWKNVLKSTPNFILHFYICKFYFTTPL